MRHSTNLNLLTVLEIGKYRGRRLFEQCAAVISSAAIVLCLMFVGLRYHAGPRR
jgi:hypothetical protein